MHRHLLGPDEEEKEGRPASTAGVSIERDRATTVSPELETRVAALEAEVARLRDTVAALAAAGGRAQPVDP